MTQKARILFVDDEKRVLNSMRGLFRREYDLFLTCEGAEAIKIAAENEIDVIVADQRMPGMTGVEVLAKMKEQSPRTVRILLTGYADPSAVEGSINIGEVFRFLSKPCPPRLLRETLSQAISASRTQPVAPAASAAAAPATATGPAASQPTPTPSTSPKVTAQPALPAQRAAPAAQPTPTPQAPTPTPTPTEAAPQPSASQSTPAARPEEPLHDNDETQPSLLTIDESTIKSSDEPAESHWQTVTNVVMSEDTVEETQENVALSSSTLGINEVGVVVFTIDSDFATTAIRASSSERNTILATSLGKVAQAVTQENTGILITDFTSNKTTLQRIIGALKKHMPELVTIVVSSGRDTTDMINLINYGQVFRYVLKPIEPEQLQKEIRSAAAHHLYLLNNPDSAKRHGVIETSEAGDSSGSVSQFIGDVRERRPGRFDPSDTMS